jgi:hypothetical protein
MRQDLRKDLRQRSSEDGAHNKMSQTCRRASRIKLPARWTAR